MTPRRPRLTPPLVLVAAAASAALAAAPPRGEPVLVPVQGDRDGPVQPQTITHAPPDPSDPAYRPILEWNKRKAAAEKALRRIRLQHFGSITAEPIRQEGIAKLRGFTDPASFPAMLEVFERDRPDVRDAVLDHFADQPDDAGLGALAWAAIYDPQARCRGEATRRVLARLRPDRLGGQARADQAAPAPTPTTDAVPMPVQQAIAAAIRGGVHGEVESAANLASLLSLYDALPMLIATQAPPSTPASGRDGQRGALAYIVVGNQTSFVRDLTPVVGTGAVGFDPDLGVLTEGVVLEVFDAFVYTRVPAVLGSMQALASEAWGGRSVAHLGNDPRAWAAWHRGVLTPYRDALAAGRQPPPHTLIVPDTPPAIVNGPAPAPANPKGSMWPTPGTP